MWKKEEKQIFMKGKSSNLGGKKAGKENTEKEDMKNLNSSFDFLSFQLLLGVWTERI